MQEQFLHLEGRINSAGTVPTLGETDPKCRNSSYSWKDPSIVQEQFLQLEGPINSAGTVPTLGETDPKCRNSSYTWRDRSKVQEQFLHLEGPSIVQEQFLHLEGPKGPINSAGAVPIDRSKVQEQFLHLEGSIQSAGTVQKTCSSAGTVSSNGQLVPTHFRCPQ